MKKQIKNTLRSPRPEKRFHDCIKKRSNRKKRFPFYFQFIFPTLSLLISERPRCLVSIALFVY